MTPEVMPTNDQAIGVRKLEVGGFTQQFRPAHDDLVEGFIEGGQTSIGDRVATRRVPAFALSAQWS